MTGCEQPHTPLAQDDATPYSTDHGKDSTMSGPQGFTPGTETRITYLDGSTWEFIILGWKEQGIVAETRSGGRIHFIPFNSVMSMSVEKPQVTRLIVDDYVSERSRA